MKTSGLALLAIVAPLASGCESIARGSEQSAVLQTEPAGADILLSDGQRCTSPCQLTVARYRTLTARISKPGCRTAFGQLVPGVTNELLTLGSIGFGPTTIGPVSFGSLGTVGPFTFEKGFDLPITAEEQMFRTLYDYQLGGAYALAPNPLTVTLACGKRGAPPRPPGLTSADQALIDSFGQLPEEPELPPPTADTIGDEPQNPSATASAPANTPPQIW